MQNSPQQNCLLFKIPAELRLKIYLFSIQHDPDIMKSTPYLSDSTSPPFRGALALLHACRTFRAEGLEAMATLTCAFASIQYHETQALVGDVRAMVEAVRNSTREFVSLLEMREAIRRQYNSVEKVEKLCLLLTNARGTGQKKD